MLPGREGIKSLFAATGAVQVMPCILPTTSSMALQSALGGGIRALALSANSAVMTCLANDVGYDRIYCEQLAVQGREGDLLIVLSGSGNSPNIVSVLERARAMNIKSYAILGYSGGLSKELADLAIHFPVDDMQIAEDMQLIVGHMLMQWLYEQRPQV